MEATEVRSAPARMAVGVVSREVVEVTAVEVATLVAKAAVGETVEEKEAA